MTTINIRILAQIDDGEVESLGYVQVPIRLIAHGGQAKYQADIGECFSAIRATVDMLGDKS